MTVVCEIAFVNSIPSAPAGPAAEFIRHLAGLPELLSLDLYTLGNEVVFDDIAAFNAAMASPVRHELRAHFRQFPPFSGRNTHFAMDRRRAPVAPVTA
jgi:hypothetical protein